MNNGSKMEQSVRLYRWQALSIHQIMRVNVTALPSTHILSLQSNGRCICRGSSRTVANKERMTALICDYTQ
jgi:hypothetical protein